MLNKIITYGLVLSFFFSAKNCLCQKVISSAGKSYSNSSGYLRFTTGEPNVKTYLGSNAHLSQGFHQNLQPSVSSCAIIISTSTTNATCGISNGSATASATGGTSPYNYQWSSGDSTASVDSLPAGIYMVTVSDSNSCSNFIPVMINNVGSPVISVASVTNVSCNGGNNGAIDISVSGGTTPYSYSWSNGATTQDITNLSMSPYEIIVTGANGCAAAQSIFVSQPAALAASTSATSASCGNADGSATAIASGGTTAYTYLWNNGESTDAIYGVSAGIYTLTITDNNNCTTTTSAAIGETGGPTLLIDSVIPAGCAGSGAVYVNITGGTSPYTYSWSNGITTQNLTNSTAGNYGLVATDSNGCDGALSASINFQQIMFDPICLITVDTATGTNKLVWQKTLGTGIASYKIYKEQTIAGIYQWVGTVTADNLSVFTDSVANPLIRSWRYKLSAVDSCGNESALSPEHKTIHLTVNQGLNNTVNLIWDDYQGFTFGTYYIYRYHASTGWVKIDSLPSNLHSYTDGTFPPQGNVDYFVEAVPPSTCTATKSAVDYNSSRSNVKGIANAVVSLSAITTDPSFIIYPNPTDGTFTVELTIPGETSTIIRVYTIMGSLVFQRDVRELKMQHRSVVNISGVSAGEYVLYVESSRGWATKKLFVK